eukprot:765230-Hanusia_phi.AAC.4
MESTRRHSNVLLGGLTGCSRRTSSSTSWASPGLGCETRCSAESQLGELREGVHLQLVVIEYVAAIEDEGWFAHAIENAPVVEIPELPGGLKLSRWWTRKGRKGREGQGKGGGEIVHTLTSTQ